MSTLYLIPTPIADAPAEFAIPTGTLTILHRLNTFVVENAKTARAVLKQLQYPRPIQGVQLLTLSEHTRIDELPALLAPLLRGEDVGLMSEAGCPGVADPGAGLVRLAHKHGISVVPLVGPSALLLALMGSGLNGQRFAFHGYLPVQKEECRRAIATRERESREQDMTQIFIETPYRNEALLQAFIDVCASNSRLCIATDLTLATESVRSATIAEWKADKTEIGRRPSVFLLYAP